MKKLSLVNIWLIILAIVSGFIPVYADGTSPYKEMYIPGTVYMRDFDNGGQGNAYFSNTDVNSGNGTYRPGECANIWKSAGGDVLALAKNEWAQYTVNVRETADYNVIMYYGTATATTVKIAFDENSVIESDLESGANYTVREDEPQQLGRMELTAGVHTVRVSVTFGGANISRIVFEKAEKIKQRTGGAYKNIYLPAVIQAEDFDYGVQGSCSADGVNNGKAYRPYEQMDIYKNGKMYYLTLNRGESCTYTVNSEQSRSYEFVMSIRGTAEADVFFDGMPYPVEIETESGSEEFCEQKLFDIRLNKGSHTIKIAAKGKMETDYIRLQSTNAQGISVDSLKNEPEKNTAVYRNLYVSAEGNDENPGTEEKPFATLNRAKEEVRKINRNMTGDIVVNILPGMYRIYEPETFDASSGGKNGYKVIYRGTNALDKPVIHGGEKVSGWTKCDDGRIWKAYLPQVDETRTLYINDIPAIRARSKYVYLSKQEPYKKEGSSYDIDGVYVNAKAFPKEFSRPEDLELIWNIAWTAQRTPVKDVIYEGDRVAIEMDQPYFDITSKSGHQNTRPQPGYTFYIENAPELLDEPGEFYFNKESHVIFYYPFEEENLNESECYVGVTEGLLSVCGQSLSSNVKNIIFDNIAFKYGAWNEASETGVVVSQADFMFTEYDQKTTRAKAVKPQIDIRHARNIIIKNCDFMCLGSSGIGMMDDVSNTEITGNLLCHIGGSGIMAGSWECRDMPEGSALCDNIKITNNVISRAANEFRGSCGIAVYYASAIDIEHNEINTLPYTGITMGWGWKNPEVKGSGNHTIAYNHVDNVTINNLDGGLLYTIGYLRGSTVHDNFFENSMDWRGGIYTDAGSKCYDIRHNVIKNTRNWAFIVDTSDAVLNVTDNFNDSVSEVLTAPESTYENNVKITDGQWPAEAKEIMKNAGLESNYSNLKNRCSYPEWRTDFMLNTPRLNTLFVSQKQIKVNARDFKEGEEDVTWHSPRKYALNYQGYRYNTNVNVYDGGGIGGTDKGDWFVYEVDITDAGRYILELTCANAFGRDVEQAKARIYLDGAECGVLPIEYTNNWNVNDINRFGELYLNEGKHELKIEFVDNAFSFEHFTFTPVCDDGYSCGYNDGEEYHIKYSDIRDADIKTAAEVLSDGNIAVPYSKKVFSGDVIYSFAPDEPMMLYDAAQWTMNGFRTGKRYIYWLLRAKELGLIEEKEQDTEISELRYAEMIYKNICAANANISYSGAEEWAARNNINLNGDNVLTRGRAAEILLKAIKNK